MASKPKELTTLHLWPGKDDPDYEVEFTFQWVNHRWIIVALNVRANLDAGGRRVDTQLLRRLPLGEMAREGFRQIGEADLLRADPWPALPDDLAKALKDRLAFLVAAHGNAPGPRSRPFSHFANLAAVYEAAARRGLAATSEVEKWAGVSKAAAEKQVLRARELGFLPEPVAGRQMSWRDYVDLVAGDSWEGYENRLMGKGGDWDG